MGANGLAGLTWQGAWNSGTTYALNDAVSYNGSSYISIQAGTNQTPDTSPTFWSLLAQMGAAGATGPAGVNGATGDAGPTGPDGTGRTGRTDRTGRTTGTRRRARLKRTHVPCYRSDTWFRHEVVDRHG